MWSLSEKKKISVVDEKKAVTTLENTARAQYSELSTHRIAQKYNELFPYKIQTQKSITRVTFCGPLYTL
jgi:hypothetical protein